MALLFQAIVFLAVRYSHAAPVPLTNPTSDGEPPYGPAPNFRGSINIFLSSIITLTLCVYTSIHLNITPEKRYYGIKTVWIYKFYWVLIALVAPEFVLYSAYMQWRNAQELCKQLRQLDPPNTSTQSDTGDAATTLPRSKQPSTEQLEPLEQNSKPPLRWSNSVTMVSAFFIVMGGFAMDISNMSDDIDYEYLALTPKGFMEFARAKLITPDILDGKDIADRSKADSLGKLLVCIQALWMVVNCIARKANGLPTTLVELNVVVHVVVAVVVYLLWWYKPLAVAHPIILRKQVDPLADRQLPTATERSATVNSPNAIDANLLDYIVLSLSNKIPSESGIVDLNSTFAQRHIKLPKIYPADANHKRFQDVLDIDLRSYTVDASRFEIRGSPARFNSDDTYKRYIVAHNSITRPALPGLLLLKDQRLVLVRSRFSLTTPKLAAYFSDNDLHRLELAFAGRRGLGDSWTNGIVDRACTTTDPPNYTVKGSIHTGGVLGMRFNSKISNDSGLVLVSTLLSCIYAGCHATAWSSHFPSYIERGIWRGSCIWIAAGIPFIDLCLRFLQSLIGRRLAKLGRILLTPIHTTRHRVVRSRTTVHRRRSLHIDAESSHRIL